MHEQFVDSLEFFNRFIEQYVTKPQLHVLCLFVYARSILWYLSFEKAKDVPTTQFRVTNIIKKWIELDFNCFERNPKLMAALKKFMDQLQSVNPQLLAYLKKAMLVRYINLLLNQYTHNFHYAGCQSLYSRWRSRAARTISYKSQEKILQSTWNLT